MPRSPSQGAKIDDETVALLSIDPPADATAGLTPVPRDGKAETRLTRRANALLLLDDGMSCEAIAKVLYLDD
jgi:hypothetical protein